MNQGPSQGLGIRVAVLRRDANRRRFRRSGAVATVVIAAASLAVVSPTATDPAAAYEFSPGLSCNELNALPGRPTSMHLVSGGLSFDTASQDSGPSSGNTYITNDKIRIKATFSLNIRDYGVREDLWEDIQEQINGGNYTLREGEVLPTELEPVSVRFMLGGEERRAVAVPASGLGTATTMTFEYVVQSGDVHRDANNATADLYIPADSFVADDYSQDKRPGFPADLRPGTSLQNISGPCGGSDVSHHAVFHPDSPGSPTVIKPPKIMSEPPTGDTYYAGEEISVRIEFSEPVSVSGRPYIELNVGGQQRRANYVAPTVKPNIPRSRLQFSYSVQSGDVDADGISVDDGKVIGGTIRSLVASNNRPVVSVSPYFMGIEAQADFLAREGGDPTVAKHLVDGSSRPAAPTAADCEAAYSADPSDEDLIHQCRSTVHMLSYGTRILSEPASGTTYTAGEHIIVRAEFVKPVKVVNDQLEVAIEFANCTPQVVKELEPEQDGGRLERLYENFPNRQGLIDDYKEFLEDDVKCIDSNGNRITTKRYAKYWSEAGRSGHTRLLFRYEITSQDQDSDGIVVPRGSFIYFDGTDSGAEITNDNVDDIITGVDGSNVYWWFSDVFEKPLNDQKANGQAEAGIPMVKSIDVVEPPSDGTYGFGEVIKLKVTFTQAVSVTGMPLLSIKIGNAYKNAIYKSGHGTSELRFEYTVVAEDQDDNGISVDANSLQSSNAVGAMKDHDDPAANASLTHRAFQWTYRVDSGAPTITGLSIVSRPPNGGTHYGDGSHIDFKVTYDEPVSAFGSLWIDFGLGSGNQPPTQRAYYDSMASDADNDDSTIVFRYTVGLGDGDPDGISIESGSINGGGTIQNANRSLDADKTFSGLGTQSGHRVETIQPTVDSVAFVSDGECDEGPYQFKDIVCVKATFSEVVWVDTDSGDPNVELLPELEVHVGNRYVPAVCDCSDGSNGLRLLFKYTVEGGDLDEDGISVDRNRMSDGGAIMTDRAGNRANLDHDPIAASDSNPDNTLDAIVPMIVGLPTIIDGLPNGKGSGLDTYGKDQVITVEIQFSENVDVAGTPQMPLEFNYSDDDDMAVTATRQAAYSESLDCDTEQDCRLRFTYQVQAGDIDTDGISIAEDAFDTNANSSKIMDASRNQADLGHGLLTTQFDHKVDAAGPLINEILVSLDADGVHAIDDVITFTVTFDEELVVDPTGVDTTDGSTSNDGLRFRFNIGSKTAYAAYDDTVGTSSQLVFKYTVVEGDLDENGITVPSNAIEERGAKVKDPFGNPSSLRNDTMTNLSDHEVDGVRPRIVGNPSVESSTHPGTSYYGADDDKPIIVQVTFSEHVLVSYAQIQLQIGDDPNDNNERIAYWEEPSNYLDGTGIEPLMFFYTVDGPDRDHDDSGISITEDSVSGNITDIAGNAPALIMINGTIAHGGITNASAHKVETTQPTVESVVVYSDSPGGDDTYHQGDAIMVKVVFSEPVIVEGTPTIDLDFDGSTETASFERILPDNESLIFTYRVVAGDEDLDGFSVKMDTLRNSVDGNITDVPRNEAVLDNPAADAGSGHMVDGDATPRGPWVMQAPTITSDPIKIDTYAPSEDIELEVMFSEDVTVSGTVYLPLLVGTETVEATLQSGNGTDKLIFGYEVETDDLDTDGVSVNPVSIVLKSPNSSIVSKADPTKRAILTVPKLDEVIGTHMVDGVAPVLDPVPAFTNTPSDGETYMKDEVIEVTAYFDTPIIFTGAAPTMRLIIGTSPVTATLKSPTTIDDEIGTSSLVFKYTVKAGDSDEDGVSIPADSISDSITDIVGNSANLTHVGIYGGLNRLVDGGPRTTTIPNNNNSGGGGGGGGGSSPNRVGRDDDRLSVRVERIGGGDRFETAQLIAERFVREISRDRSLPEDQRMVDTVVIASGRAFPDALTASALAGSALSPIALSSSGLAGSRNAPLLLTEPNELPSFTKEFLVENEIEHVYIVGGTGAISSGVEAAIAALPSVTSVMRFGGADRYATSVSIASEVTAMMGGAGEFCGTSLRTALLAVGDDFADALAFAPISARGPHPLLLTRRDDLPDSVREYFAAAAELGTIEHVVIAGGTFAVSDAVVDELVEMGLNVTRIGGGDRFDTSVRIATYVLRAAASGQGACLDTNRVAFATGLVYADGLSGGPLMAHLSAPTVLLWPKAVPKQVDGFLSWHLLDHENLTLFVLGGSAALSYGVIRTVRVAVQNVLDLD